MSHVLAAKPLRPLTGRHVLVALLALFVPMIAVNALFIYLAVTTFSGIETENAYRRGLAYNLELETAAVEAALGWQGRIRADGRTPILTLTDKSGAPLAGKTVRARTGRPSNDRFDQVVTFRETEAGRYQADAALDPGAWIIVVDVRDTSGQSLRIKERLWLSR